jgi:Spy/CpxP family protein refolding chaperone
MKRLLMIGALLAVAGSLGAAEFDLPPGKWWENERLAKHIDLSPEQQQQISDKVYEHAIRMIDLEAAVKRTGLELANEVSRAEFKPDQVRAFFGEFQNARRALETERFEMLLSVRQVLSSEQWLEIQNVRQRMRQSRGDRPDEGRPPRDRFGGRSDRRDPADPGR